MTDADVELIRSAGPSQCCFERDGVVVRTSKDALMHAMRDAGRAAMRDALRELEVTDWATEPGFDYDIAVTPDMRLFTVQAYARGRTASCTAKVADVRLAS